MMSIPRLTSPHRAYCEGRDGRIESLRAASYSTYCSIIKRHVHVPQTVAPKLTFDPPSPKKPMLKALDLGCGDLRMITGFNRLIGARLKQPISLVCNDIDPLVSKLSEEVLIDVIKRPPWHGDAKFSIQDMVEEVKSGGSDLFDFILCSHALYYLDKSIWLDFIKRALSKLTLGGYLVIVMRSNRGDVWNGEAIKYYSRSDASHSSFCFAEDLVATLSGMTMDFTVQEVDYTSTFPDQYTFDRSLEFLYRIEPYSIEKHDKLLYVRSSLVKSLNSSFAIKTVDKALIFQRK